MQAKDRIIVALDVDSIEKATDLVAQLKGEVGTFKVGLELVDAAGFGVFDAIKAAGAERIFYDSKFHDIPNTVAGASTAATSLGVWMFNVHAAGGSAMMSAARQAADRTAIKAGCRPPKIIAVTLLTSIDEVMLVNELHIGQSPREYVRDMAILAKGEGLDGVVASPIEVNIIRDACGPDFLIVTPGVRPTGSDVNDQARVMTPSQAIAAGADYLVIGRPITQSPDPVVAARAIALEISGS